MFRYVLYKFVWIIGSGSEILQETSFGFESGSEIFFGFVTALMFIASQQGELLKFIKTNIPKTTQIQSYLKTHDIIYSPQKCRSLIILYDLVSEFNPLLQCDVPVSLLVQNSKTIREICKELKW